MSRGLLNYYLNQGITHEENREDRKRAGRVALAVAVITVLMNLTLNFLFR